MGMGGHGLVCKHKYIYCGVAGQCYVAFGDCCAVDRAVAINQKKESIEIIHGK